MKALRIKKLGYQLNEFDINWSAKIVGAFKGLILWIEDTEDKNDLDINWSATSLGAFKRPILWIEGIVDKND